MPNDCTAPSSIRFLTMNSLRLWLRGSTTEPISYAKLFPFFFNSFSIQTCLLALW